MELRHGDEHYRTRPLEDNSDGFAGLELRREVRGKSETVARVIFWDAVGQYYVNTFNDVDLPVKVMEAFIHATKDHVGIA